MKTPIDYKRHTHRSFGFGFIGVILMGLSGWAIYDLLQNKPLAVSTPMTYDYQVVQSVDNSVEYVKNSFFENGPGPNDTAYVTDLTDKIRSTFHYEYNSQQPANVEFTYDVRAVIKASYSLGGDGEKTDTVWRKEFQLVSPVTETIDGTTFRADPVVDINLAEYKKLTDQFRSALSLPTNNSMVVTFTARANGIANGTAFSDTKTQEISAPLDQQLYKLAVKYEKESKKQVVEKKTRDARTVMQRYQLIASGVVFLLGLGLFGFGLRKRIFKTPYQRELERIFRYYDGIIIRANKQPDFSGKNIVQVESFDDMLNLEEGLKSPIVANHVGGEATRFSIIHNDVVYSYLLGNVSRENTKSVEQIARSVAVTSPAKHKK